MTDVEIEIKVRITQPARLIKFLSSQAKFIHKTHQKDDYFNAPNRDFLARRPVQEWLRLRQSNNTAAITYKNWHYEPGGKFSHYADEYETTISDAEQLRKILLALGFKPLITVEKTRQSWLYQDYEISLDEVTSLGNFVEVEFKGPPDLASPKQMTQQMVDFLKGIDCGRIERSLQGYPYLLLYPDKAKFETV